MQSRAMDEYNGRLIVKIQSSFDEDLLDWNFLEILTLDWWMS